MTVASLPPQTEMSISDRILALLRSGNDAVRTPYIIDRIRPTLTPGSTFPRWQVWNALLELESRGLVKRERRSFHGTTWTASEQPTLFPV